MAKDWTQILKFLFPESQIIESIKERGFISTKKSRERMAGRQGQTYMYGNVQQTVSGGQQASVNAPKPIQTVPQVPQAGAQHPHHPQHPAQPSQNGAGAQAKDAFVGLPEELKKYCVRRAEQKYGMCRV